MARIKGIIRGHHEQCRIRFEPFGNAGALAAQHRHLALAAFVQQHGVQFFKTLRHRYRHHEVAPPIADKAFDFAFVVAFAGAAEPVLEQIVALQARKHRAAPALAIAENLRHGELGIIV